MKIINVKQGTQEWLDLRSNHFTASEASAMMGDSKYMSRDELLRMKKTGVTEPVTASKQALFDKGHKAEAMARPIAERLHGDEFYPVTGVSDEYPKLLASFDGLALNRLTCWEHKLFNATLAENVRNQILEPSHYWQLEQQLLVSGAAACMFTTSDGTEEQCEHFYYYSVPSRRADLIAGWEQFEKDLEDYVVEAKPEVIVADELNELPDLYIKVTGMVESSNLSEFKTSATKFISNINTNLVSDLDFATAEKTVKFCDKAEKHLESMKKEALDQTATIAELFETIDEIKGNLRDVRLDLSKKVKTLKASRKDEIIYEAKNKLALHISNINLALKGVFLPEVPCDFLSAAKNKRNLSSIQSACNDELAKAKIIANKLAEEIKFNLSVFNNEALGFDFLFKDLQLIITKDSEDLINLIRARIMEFKKSEEERKDREEQARIFDEEKAKRDKQADQPTVKENITVEPTPIAAQQPEVSEVSHCVEQGFTRSEKEIDISCWLFDNTGITQEQARAITHALVTGKVPHISAIQSSKVA